MLVKRVGPELDSASIILIDPMPEPDQADIPDLKNALASAMETRLELKQADINLKNQNISVDFTGDGLKPALSVFGFYAGAGLQGTGAETKSGMLNAFGQSFEGEFPEYATGFSLSIPLRNRTAQADNIRSQLERNQLLITQQRSRNTISLEVRKAIIGLEQGKAQVEAAHKAASLAREMWEGEKVKLEAGASTSYQVILRERDYTNARYAEVGAMVSFAKAIVEIDRATGETLKQNGIEYSDALSGKVSKTLRTPFNGRGQQEVR
jgi:outer membrane protein TolC